MENNIMPEMQEMVNLVDNFIDDFNAIKTAYRNEDDDFAMIASIRTKYYNKIYEFVHNNDDYVEFEKNCPIITDHIVTSLEIGETSHYLYINTDNGDSLLETDLGVEDLLTIARSLK